MSRAIEPTGVYTGREAAGLLGFDTEGRAWEAIYDLPIQSIRLSQRRLRYRGQALLDYLAELDKPAEAEHADHH